MAARARMCAGKSPYHRGLRLAEAISTITYSLLMLARRSFFTTLYVGI